MKRWKALLTVLALCVGMSGIALAQDWDHDHDRDHDRDRDYIYHGDHDRGPYGNGAAQFGYRDGFNDGRNDAVTGHSFRPTQDSNYRHAENGYNGAYWNKGAYRQAYREAYLQGYQNGYGRGQSSAYRRWPWGR